MATGETPRLSGSGLLATEAWIDFLSRVGEDPARDAALTARNFVLDEGVTKERATSYTARGAVVDHGEDVATWRSLHEAYLAERVRVFADDDGPPAQLDPARPDEHSETFRFIDTESPYLSTDANVHLLRVEEISSIAALLGEGSARVKTLLREFLDGPTTDRPRLEKAVNDLLEAWFVGLDQRPVYAGFWADLEDLFGETADDDSEGWADTLRDRLGLAHLDPARSSGELGRGDLDVVVFRYPVDALPGVKGRRDERPLLPPTVLDGPFSDAFCPSPRDATTGHVVHLEPEGGKLRREVLHPRACFRASQIWRLGTLKRSVDVAGLPVARGVHLLLIQAETGKEDYARGTDGDLL